jgi:hypothetical protein
LFFKRKAKSTKRKAETGKIKFLVDIIVDPSFKPLAFSF